MSSMLKISISGVRGIANDSLTPDVCLSFAKAFGTYLKGGKVVVGTDTRASSEFIKGIVMQGLISCGCQVIDLGIAPTPTVGFMAKELKAAGGLVVTASHNPPQWNGLKFIRGDGIFLNQGQMEELIELYERKIFVQVPGGKVKSQSKPYELHINKVVRSVKASAIRPKKFKVVYDACNGAGSIITGMLLKKLGCQVVALNCDTKKPFPHGAEPTPANLEELCAAVKKEKAAVGFAQDPDADRLALVIDGGEAISEEYTLALAVQHVLSRALGGKRIVVINLSTSKITEDVAKSLGAVVIRTKIGEVHVAEELKREKGRIGGEGNGGVIYPQVGYMRDSLAGIALILELLAQSGQKLSEIVDTLPKYYMYKTKVECKDQSQVEALVEKAKEILKDETVDLTDGVKVYLPEGSLQVRASNTEPIVRIFSEAKTPEQAKKLSEDLKSQIS
jgi:phosphomannomutase